MTKLTEGKLHYCWFCCENVYSIEKSSLNSHMKHCKEAYTAGGFHKELACYLKRILTEADEQSLDELKSLLRDAVGERNGKGMWCRWN